ncbi:hypothetical protein CVT25_002050 [Psilocybe cyanescens]|uniref:Uncharacterized protein n=1 Tax=Psilocybe cyanescens TaxID=93625 RepID=A0A409X6E5_PSICY|nr:hypothetical protein CVT25_002050 [Psilocybe cyanescens]
MANSSEALITPPPNAGQVPAVWGSLLFHPVGIYDLQRHLGTLSSEPGIFTAFRDQFDYADLAWFAPGLAKSSLDSLPPYKFYSEYLILRENVPWNAQGTDLRSTLRKCLQELLFDTAALLDRTFGGTTLIVHVEGGTRPGSLKQPEYVKADVYFPNHMIRKVPHTSKAVFDIIQRFIRDIGDPTIVRFEKCVEKLWKLSKPTATPPPYPAQHAHPSASPPGSSIFTYYGQRQSVIVLSDSDDNDEDTTLSDQLSACLKKQSELNTELCQVQEILQQTEGALANSQ